MDIEENNETVDSLIYSNTMEWNTQKIRALFNPIIAVDILKIVICPRDHKYKWTWAQEKNGKYTVKSAYRFFREQQNRSPGES